MASKRVVATDIFEDEFFTGLTQFQRLVWLGIIIRCADDQGRLQDNALIIRSQVFPADDVTVEDIEWALVLFARALKIERYTAGGKQLAQVVNWWKYQAPPWASASKFPAPQGWIDRVKMHVAGNKIVMENWDAPGGYEIPFVADDDPTYQPVSLRSQLHSQLPRAIEERRGEESRGNERRVKETPIFGAIAPAPQEHLEIEKKILEYWKEIFPNKPQPRPGTFREKITARWKEAHFRDHWQAALERSAKSKTLQVESWFNFEFFIRNKVNYQKMLDGWMDWKDGEKVSLQANGRPSTASIIDRVFTQGVNNNGNR